MNALEARSLTQRYGGFTAVDAVDLDLAEGTIRGLIGPNGAGKSSLIDALSGRSTSARGEIRLQGTGARGSPCSSGGRGDWRARSNA